MLRDCGISWVSSLIVLILLLFIFLFLNADVHLPISYGVYFSQLIHFDRVSSYVGDFNNLNKLLTAKLLQLGLSV